METCAAESLLEHKHRSCLHVRKPDVQARQARENSCHDGGIKQIAGQEPSDSLWVMRFDPFGSDGHSADEDAKHEQ
jgi:hypothetical protein